MTALIDPQSLYEAIQNNPAVRLVDASWPPQANYPVIGNAVAFDIDAVADLSNHQSHTLPSADDFAAAVGRMGISNDDMVVIYDQTGMAMAAARVWWMFRVFGHKNLRILDGGLPFWAASGLPLAAPGAAPEPVVYTATFNPALFTETNFILDHLNDPGILIADARPADRFAGLMPDLRPGMPSGHIPGSTSLPTGSLLDPATGKMLHDDPRIAAILESAPERIIATCGSGVTACVIALAFHEAGFEDVAVYGGSWAEWGHPDLGLPVEQGEGKTFAPARK